MSIYNFNELEKKWREIWKKDQVYKVTEQTVKPKYYVLDMFPYPSGAGLHVGHPLGYIGSDVVARFKRLQGYNVLHPMGFDAFGLPAEQYAIETGVQPIVSTDKNIERYKEQLNNIGFSFDWDREVKTCDPDFYKWTQWIFLQLYESWFNPELKKAEPISKLIEQFGLGLKINSFSKPWNELTELEQQTELTQYRLAYKAESTINWCEALGTVLANDEVVNGVSERGGHPVERKLMSQWFLRITAFADRLLDGLETVDFPESLKEMQKNWIGKSEGAEIQFEWIQNKIDLTQTIISELSEAQTEAEVKLGQQLQISVLGVTFRKQFPVDIYHFSFVSTSPKICIEIIDSQANSSGVERAKQLGYKLLRISAEEVVQDIDLVIKKIEIKIAEAKILESLNQTENDAKISSLSHSGFSNTNITCFTTRPDTIFGVSFMVLAPEHPLVETITTAAQKLEVEAYVTYCKSRSELERKSETREVTGAFTGAHVKHPFTGNTIPVYIAEYVLMGYGTGAIMAVPCGDGRDFLFAKKFNLPIPNIFEGVDIQTKAYEEKTGNIANSACSWFSMNGLSLSEAKNKSIYELEDLGCGTKKINYRMRDAGFSRQRYWGEPFPISYKNDLAFPDDLTNLPIRLPVVKTYKPAGDGKSPLSTLPDWVNLPNGNVRETDTMPGYAGSSWYYLRYMDPQNPDAFCDKQKSDYWQQVDLYIGGAEHAVGHLLYSRMWCKVLCDLGFISFDEPYKKLLNQGMIGGIVYYAYYDATAKKFYSYSLTPNTEGLLQFQFPNEYVGDDENLDQEEIERFCNEFTQFKSYEFVMDNGKFSFEKAITKMSKRLRNVVNPDEIIEKYGADSFRMYEMFLGPIDQDKPWNTKGIDGVSRFLKRFWAYFINEDGTVSFNQEPASTDALKTINRTLKKIAEDIEKYAFNTCISSFMICLNELQDQKCKNAELLQKFLIMLSPFAPHICQEIWQRAAMNGYILEASYPTIEEKYLSDDSFNYPISINGKTRTLITFSLDANQADIERIVLSDETVIKWLESKPVKKFILVKGRIVNVVV